MEVVFHLYFGIEEEI